MEGPIPHESPWQMTLPLWILGGLSLVAGFFNAHLLHVAPLGHFLEPIFATASKSVEVSEEGVESFKWIGAAIAVFVAATPGIAFAWYTYVVKGGAPAREAAAKLPQVHAFLSDKWRVDEFYKATILDIIDSLADMCVWFDKWIVDGILARASAFIVQVSGALLRQFQTGRVQAYSGVLMLGLLGVGGYLALPHANVRETFDHASGVYKLSAAPGLGYKYRWDVDGQEGWDGSGKFGARTEATFQLKLDEERSVRLEVEGPLLATSTYEMILVRPRDAASGVGGEAPPNSPKAAGSAPAMKLPPGHPPTQRRPAAPDAKGTN